VNFGYLPDLARMPLSTEDNRSTYLAATGNKHEEVIFDYAKLVINKTYERLLDQPYSVGNCGHR
jgi:hypothetical protein